MPSGSSIPPFRVISSSMITDGNSNDFQTFWWKSNRFWADFIEKHWISMKITEIPLKSMKMKEQQMKFIELRKIIGFLSISIEID